MRINYLLTPLLAAALLLLAACAPAPLYKPAPDTAHASPSVVAQTPEQFTHANVIWGGRIIKVTNLSDETRIELLAYPLDSGQRPQIDDGARGRFIVVVPGYLEPLDYPPGRLMTFSGQLLGVHTGAVGKANYAYPMVAATRYHLWSADEMRSPWSNVNFGVGVGAIF